MQLLKWKKLFTDNDNLIDCDKSFDGSWQKEVTCQRMVLYQVFEKTNEKVLDFVVFINWESEKDTRVRAVLFLFSIRVFFHGHWQLTEQQGKGGDHLLFHSTNSTCSRTCRYLFVIFYVRWLSHIFNHNAFIYQTATQWDLPPYRITIWLIDDVILIFVCLHVELILGFVTAIWHEKPVDSNSHRLSSLCYKRTD